MLFSMLAFFGVVIAVNLTMAMLASKSWTGLVVKNSYVASQAFNRELEQAKLQHARGWTGTISYTQGAIELKLTDRNDAPVILQDVMVLVGRPAFEQSDHRLPMQDIGNGVYRVDDALAAGIWQVSIRGKSTAGDYRLDTRLTIEANPQ
jgi:nitrogen fixation protein FixH